MGKNSRPTTLVVDDEAVIRELYQTVLLEEGHEVVLASTKKEALEHIANREFDLLLLDKNLPDGSGLDVMAEAHRLKHGSEAIMVTSFTDTTSAKEALDYKVYRYMSKPVNLDTLTMEIRGALQTRALRIRLIKRAEQLEEANAELAKSEQRFREIAELLPGILIDVNDSRQLTYVNQHGLDTTGYTRDEFYMRFADFTFLAPEDRERAKRDFAVINRQGREIQSAEYTVLFKDGRRIPVISRSYPIVRNEKIVGLSAILFDISEHKEAEKVLREKEAQLQHSQKLEAIGTLAGGLAHDFNNILGAIKAYGDIVLLELHKDDPIFSDMQGISKAADRASELTRQLLAFGRKQVLRPKSQDLNKVVQGMVNMLKRLIREDIDLKMQLGESLPPVFADQGQIEQVIMNLVVNARDAMPGGGTIIISTSSRKKGTDELFQQSGNGAKAQVCISVSDDGVGMDQVTMSRIFEPFFTTKERGSGTGLGLATAYGIIKQSGGEIRVQSTPNSGTVFDVLLPASKEEPMGTTSQMPDSAQLGGVRLFSWWKTMPCCVG
jgi:PAS domain S-box-containing protein